MFDRLLHHASGEARTKLLAVMALTSWGTAGLSVFAGWQFGLFWFITGLGAFVGIRRLLVPTPKPAARRAKAADAEDLDDEADEVTIATMQGRVMARLHEMATSESPVAEAAPVDDAPVDDLADAEHAASSAD
jgi:hypothetical protein